MKHLIIAALFLSTTTACGSSTTVVNREPIGNAGNPGIEETGGSDGSIGQAGSVSETGGNVGTTGGTGGNTGTGGNSTGATNTGGTVNQTDYSLPETCGLIMDQTQCKGDYPNRPINFLCANPNNYPELINNHISIYPTNPTNKTIDCIKDPYLEIVLYCCTPVG